MGWRSSGVGLVAVLIFFAGSLRAQEGEGGAPITMPDVRGNVMRMLEESRQQHDTLATEPPSSSLPASAEEQEPLAPSPPLPSAIEAAPSHETAAEPPQPPLPARPQSTPPRAAHPPKPAVSPRRDGHVPLEQKEITIQNLDDVRKLAEELKAAKKRQGEQNRAP